MRLSDSDRRTLAQIARAIEEDDPAFAGAMAWPTDRRGSISARSAAADRPRWRRWDSVVVWALLALFPMAVIVLVAGLAQRSAAGLAVGLCLVTLDGVALVCIAWFRRRIRAG